MAYSIVLEALTFAEVLIVIYMLITTWRGVVVVFKFMVLDFALVLAIKNGLLHSALAPFDLDKFLFEKGGKGRREGRGGIEEASRRMLISVS